jgi:hypothetical protein
MFSQKKTLKMPLQGSFENVFTKENFENIFMKTVWNIFTKRHHEGIMQSIIKAS